MGRGINPIRKKRLKQALIRNQGNARKSLKEIGASKNIINHSTTDKCVKVCLEEIQREIKDEITIEYVLGKLKREVEGAKYSSDRIRATELLGRYLAMFTDKIKDTTEDKQDGTRLNDLFTSTN